MKRHLLLALCAIGGPAVAADGFTGLHCDTDIARALQGRHMSNEAVAATEARHKELSLKHLGADELDWGNQVWWQICGARYTVLLDKHDTVRDALKLPEQQPGTAAFQGSCKGAQGEVIAVVQAKDGAAELPAIAAWKIDDAKQAFVPVLAAGLRCSRDGLLDEAH